MTSPFIPELSSALAGARYIYLTTYSATGQPRHRATWCWLHDGALYFTTSGPASRPRRIKNDGG